MNNKSILKITLIVIFLMLINPISITEEINFEMHNIEITKDANQISIVESLNIKGDTDGYYETITFWIQPDQSNLEILIDGKNPNSINSIDQNLFECNVSGLNIPINQSVQVNIEYILPGNKPNFQKKITQDTSEITITYNGEDLKINNVLKDTYFTISLLPTKSTTNTVSSNNTFYLVLIFILVIIILLLLISRRRSKTSTHSIKTEVKTASEELLSTKKTLLMELLKDIEKKHRSKEISDDTYHKLKDRYKQEAVEAMKQLEDMKSKVR
jgi:hypothetical protein